MEKHNERNQAVVYLIRLFSYICLSVCRMKALEIKRKILAQLKYPPERFFIL